jgi:FAD/FMN-containing dehydrogenase
MTDILSRLVAICGPDRVSDKLADRICHTRDCGPSPGGLPAYVVRPTTTQEVSDIVRLANEVKTPIFIWGRSTTFIGNGIKEGCILMALDLMSDIEQIDLDNKAIRVQTGAVWHAVDVELNKIGWELAVPGPGGMFSCSIGGSVAYNATPHAIAEYGMTGDNVVGLEVVLPDGQILQTGSGANEAAGQLQFERYSNGPDLTGLFIGSNGVFGVITRVIFRIRRVPETEEFAFYGFNTLDQAVDAAHAVQRQQAATHLVGVMGGPKPAGYEQYDAFLHIIVRDSKQRAGERRGIAAAACEAFNGYPLDSNATRNYWVGHMYSWLRNMPPDFYYGNRPYMCPEVAGFVPTNSVKDAIRFVRQDSSDRADEWEKYGIRHKGFDVYFTRNAAFLWIDTLYPELEAESWKYGLALRSRWTSELMDRYMSPGGILQAIAPEVTSKLGAGFEFWKLLKRSLDPNFILNPGVLNLDAETAGATPREAAHV